MSPTIVKSPLNAKIGASSSPSIEHQMLQHLSAGCYEVIADTYDSISSLVGMAILTYLSLLEIRTKTMHPKCRYSIKFEQARIYL